MFKRYCATLISSPWQPKLSMAKCRRNVENFLEACRRMGVEQVSNVCLESSILKIEVAIPRVHFLYIEP